MASDLPGRQGETTFKPGQSGNPKGRPPGSKNKLGEDFVRALHDDFTAHGIAVIEKVREEQPAQYLRVIASIVPKELHIKDASLEDMSDDELIEYAAAVRTALAADRGQTSKPGTRKAKTKKDTGATGRTH